jgi:hypothetical protein
MTDKVLAQVNAAVRAQTYLDRIKWRTGMSAALFAAVVAAGGLGYLGGRNSAVRDLAMVSAVATTPSGQVGLQLAQMQDMGAVIQSQCQGKVVIKDGRVACGITVYLEPSVSATASSNPARSVFDLVRLGDPLEIARVSIFPSVWMAWMAIGAALALVGRFLVRRFITNSKEA